MAARPGLEPETCGLTVVLSCSIYISDANRRKNWKLFFDNGLSTLRLHRVYMKNKYLLNILQLIVFMVPTPRIELGTF